MRTFTILVATGLLLSVSGIASATPDQTSVTAPATEQAAKVKSKRRVIRKVLPTQNEARPVFSDKGWISVSNTSNAKTKIVKPTATKARTPNMFGR